MLIRVLAISLLLFVYSTVSSAASLDFEQDLRAAKQQNRTLIRQTEDNASLRKLTLEAASNLESSLELLKQARRDDSQRKFDLAQAQMQLVSTTLARNHAQKPYLHAKKGLDDIRKLSQEKQTALLKELQSAPSDTDTQSGKVL
ncbi:MAG: hypothetical protein IPJ88_05105 [Myxococcales bacterium]|nr:MAG: hypothetical protein IPJ88_05105 [Myxococcales bacterium]